MQAFAHLTARLNVRGLCASARDSMCVEGFEEGLGLVKACRARLDEAELKVRELLEEET